MRWKSAVAFVLLAGCASTKDIHLDRLEPTCAHSCSTTYSDCLSKFSLFPIERQNECTDALKLCADSCPSK